jgi:hypothetical protein
MLFCNKDLINIIGFSEATFYRRLKDKNIKIKKTGIYFDETTARNVFEQLGFKSIFENYIKQKANGKTKK